MQLAETGLVGGSRLEERRPAAPLADFVSFQYIKIVGSDQPYSDLSVPSGCVELRCRLGSMPWVIGPRDGPLRQVLAPGTVEVGLRLRAGVASCVLGLPISKLLDQTVSMADLLGRGASVNVAEQIANSTSPAEAMRPLQQFVAMRLSNAPGPDPLAFEVMRRVTPLRTEGVSTLSAALGVSERQLRRRCHSSIGLGPKALHRLVRFQGFLALAHRSRSHPRFQRGYDLAGLAADAGYTDQSHLTRECVRLTSRTPSSLLDEFARDCVGHDHNAGYEPMLR